MGGFAQIFRLFSAMDALTELAEGYENMARACRDVGDHAGYERHLDRMQDALGAVRIISDLRAPKMSAAIISVTIRKHAELEPAIIEGAANNTAPALPLLPLL